MNGYERKRYEMLVRVRDFGIAHRDLFPRSEKGGKALEQIAAAVDELGGQVAAQFNGHGSAHEGTTNKVRARDALRQALEAICQTARAVAIDRPGFDRKFRFPRRKVDRVLIDTAQAFLDEATPLKADFVAHSLAPNFLAELKTRVAEFEEATSDQQSAKDTHVAATVAITAALTSGMEAVRRLDAIVRNRLRDDAQTRAVWARARRIGEPPAARSKSTAARPASTPASPQPAPAVPTTPTPAPAQSPVIASTAVT